MTTLTLTLPRWGVPDWTTLARVITNDLGIPFHAHYDDETHADPYAPEMHIDLSAVTRTQAVDACAFWLDTHPEIRWRLT